MQKRAEWRRVDHAMCSRYATGQPDRQPETHAKNPRKELHRLDREYIRKIQVSPEFAQVEALLLKRAGVICQVGDIDGARRNAGQEWSFQIGKTLGDSPQHADL